ncbi:PLDc N-terminal domain-containing protein [Halobacillus sp. Marseille-P3879]|uniref:PLDc N-terminal domain-containing protein n=1 Tax=Halobacillus TaxID=45667 RepID=UPI001F2D465D|nr:PLDc N-terminal domain-containing protein [Halobacillus sp. Marseille-P3879]
MEIGLIFLIFILFGLALFIFNIITSVWAYRDSKRKGNSQVFTLVVLLGTLFFPVVGLIVYLIIRND